MGNVSDGLARYRQQGAAVQAMGAADRRRQIDRQSSGELYDPLTDPGSPISNEDDSRLGDNANNYVSREQQLLNHGMNDYTRREQMAAGSRTAADASAGRRPTYQAPGAYQTPTYDAPEDFAFEGEYGQSRPGLEGDDAVASRYRQYASLTGADNPHGGAQDYQADQVGDYGQAFNTWLQGAQSSFLKGLGRQQSTLNESAAARGRLDSGFYNLDTGTLQRETAGQFSDAAQQAALQAAGLSLQGASGNADRALSAAGLRNSAYNTAQAGKSSLLSDALGRSQYLDTARGDAFESDRGAFERNRDFALGAYDDARNFGRSTFENDRDFGRTSYDDDRDFGYNAYRDQNADFEDTRNFDETRYNNDEARANDSRDYYADYLSGLHDRFTGQQQYDESKPTGFERAVSAIAPIVNTVSNFIPGVAAAKGASNALGKALKPKSKYGAGSFA